MPTTLSTTNITTNINTKTTTGDSTTQPCERARTKLASQTAHQVPYIKLPPVVQDNTVAQDICAMETQPKERLFQSNEGNPYHLRQPRAQLCALTQILPCENNPTANLDTNNKLPDSIYHTLRRAKKAVLHLHVKGSTPLILLIHDRLKKEQDIRSIPTGEQYSNELSIHGHQTEKTDGGGELMAQSSLAHYREQYAELSNIAKTPDGAFLTYYLLMREQAAHGVRYVELRTGIPLTDPESFIEHCVRGCQEAQRDLAGEQKQLDFGILLLMNRGASGQSNHAKNVNQTQTGKIQQAYTIAQTAISLRQQGYPIVGIDLAGDESQHAVSDFAPVFELIHTYNRDPQTPPHLRLGITIHAGETQSSTCLNGRVLDSYESVEEAVRIGSSPVTPLRIGHGVGIMRHPVLKKAFEDYVSDPTCVDDPDFKTRLFETVPLLKQLKDQNICLETCPKSNYQTQAVAAYSTHPAIFLSRIGIRINVSPDNTIISKTNPTNEFVKLFRYQSGFKGNPSKNETGMATAEHNAQALHQFIQFMNRCYQDSIHSAFIFNESRRKHLLEYLGT